MMTLRHVFNRNDVIWDDVIKYTRSHPVVNYKIVNVIGIL